MPVRKKSGNLSCAPRIYNKIWHERRITDRHGIKLNNPTNLYLVKSIVDYYRIHGLAYKKHTHTHTYTHIYIYIYIYSLSSTDRLFRSIRTLQGGYNKYIYIYIYIYIYSQ